MAVLKRRTRLISFRISDEEYQDLVAKTAAGGARSISDFSRAALFQALTPNGNLTNVEQMGSSYVVDLIKSMQELGRVITELSGRIEKHSVVKEA